MINHPSYWLSLLPVNFDPMWEESCPEQLPEETAYALRDFVRHGSHVFSAGELDNPILKDRELEEIVIEQIMMPAESFYIDFDGLVQAVSPVSGCLIEGVYLSRSRHQLRGVDEGSIDVTLVPATLGNEEDDTYWFSFEFFSNDRGYIHEGKSTTAKQQLDRRFENLFERMGKFNYERSKLSIGGTESYENAVKNWKPDNKDMIWKEASEICICAAFNLTEYFHEISHRISTIKVHHALHAWNE